jgi:hypothetical protein
MCKAVSATNSGPPRTEPFTGFRLEENFTDVVDQEALNEIGKARYCNILNPENLLKEIIVLFTSINTLEILHVVTSGRCNSYTHCHTVQSEA